MTSLAQPIDTRSSKAGTDAPSGWYAAVIDEKGNEVPITETMIARACEELSASWVFPRARQAIAR